MLRAEQHALIHTKAQAISQLRAGGVSYARIAEHLNVSRQRLQQIEKRSRQLELTKSVDTNHRKADNT